MKKYYLVIIILSFLGCSQPQKNKIGNQIWMTENLQVTHYLNGDEIPQVKSKDEMVLAAKEEKGVWCYIDDNYNITDVETKYGRLYNHFAVVDPRGLAPAKGWHIPKREEFDILFEHLGGIKNALPLLKDKYGWEINGTNESGFSARPTANGAAVYWTSSGPIKNGYVYNFLEDEIKEGDKDIYGIGAVRCIYGY